MKIHIERAASGDLSGPIVMASWDPHGEVTYASRKISDPRRFRSSCATVGYSPVERRGHRKGFARATGRAGRFTEVPV